MPRYTFFGRVLPERASFNCTPVSLEISEADSPICGKLLVSFEASQLSVKAILSKCDVDLDTLKESIQTVVSGISDAFCYTRGYGYDIEITSAVDETGKQSVFGVHAPIVPAGLEIDFGALIGFVGQDINLRFALASLREGIRVRHDAGFFSYRAVESIRQNFDETGAGDSGQAWRRMREALNLNEASLKALATRSVPVRHGKPLSVTGADANQVLRAAWLVIFRYHEFVRLGRQPLPKEAFPELRCMD